MLPLSFISLPQLLFPAPTIAEAVVGLLLIPAVEEVPGRQYGSERELKKRRERKFLFQILNRRRNRRPPIPLVFYFWWSRLYSILYA